MVNHDVRLLGCHNWPSYYVAWTPNLKRILIVLKLISDFNLLVRH